MVTDTTIIFIMLRKQVKDKLYELIRYYKTDVGESRKIGSKITRDSLVEVFTVRCPNDICRDKECIIVTYRKKYYDMIFKIRQNARNDICNINQSIFCNGDLIYTEDYKVFFPDDTKLLKKKVKNDTFDFYNKEGV